MSHAVHGSLFFALVTLAGAGWGARAEHAVDAPARVVRLSGDGVREGWYDGDDLTAAVRQATLSARVPARVDGPVRDGDSLVLHGGWLVHAVDAAAPDERGSGAQDVPADMASLSPAQAVPAGPSPAAVAALALGKPLSLQHASAADLEALPGVGPTLARRIVEGRPYRTVEDLDRVKGIGPRKMDALRRMLVP